MRSTLLVATRFYLVLAVLAGVPAGANRAVLCVAPNGHVAIEVGEGRCADRAPAVNGTIENTGICTVPDGCGDCVDLPMGKQILGAARHGAPASQVAAASILTLGNATSVEMPGAPTQLVSARVAIARPAFPPSRTTILRN